MNNGFTEHGREVVAPMEHCWRRVGVGGDRSCPELTTFIHCRNCPVVAAAARHFFERPAPAGYLEAWGEILAAPEATSPAVARSVLVFRLGNEWLALPTAALVEVTTPRTLHRVPHRSGNILAGLVNIRGQLQLCVRLTALLGLETPPADSPFVAPAARLLVIEHRGERGMERWAFGVDEVAGVHRLPPATLGSAPSTVSNAAQHMTAGLFAWHDKNVGLLDDARLLNGLTRMVSG